MSQAAGIRSVYHFTICLGLPLGIWFATASLMSVEPATGGIDLRAGSVKFRDYCGACHILDPGITTHHGPNLHDIGHVAASRRPEYSAAEYILESILAPDTYVASENHAGMPKNLATDLAPNEIRNIVAFLASRGGRPDYDEILRLEIPDLRKDPAEKTLISRARMELGQQVLEDKGTCLQCHGLHLNAEYEVFAPALFGVGLIDRTQIHESIVDPHKVIEANFRSVQVLLENGQVLTGKLISRDADRLVLFSVDRAKRNQLTRHEIPLAEIEHEDGKPVILESSQSPMPTGFDQILTPEELEAVVAMIQQLN